LNLSYTLEGNGNLASSSMVHRGFIEDSSTSSSVAKSKQALVGVVSLTEQA
jgi:hypothetical protein